MSDRDGEGCDARGDLTEPTRNLDPGRDAAGALLGAAIGRLGDRAFKALDDAGVLKVAEDGGMLSEPQLKLIARTVIQANADALGFGASDAVSGRHDLF